MQFFDSKYQMNTLEKSLKFKYIAVLWLYTLLHLSNNIDNCLKANKFNLCPGAGCIKGV